MTELETEIVVLITLIIVLLFGIITCLAFRKAIKVMSNDNVTPYDSKDSTVFMRILFLWNPIFKEDYHLKYLPNEMGKIIPNYSTIEPYQDFRTRDDRPDLRLILTNAIEENWGRVDELVEGLEKADERDGFSSDGQLIKKNRNIFTDESRSIVFRVDLAGLKDATSTKDFQRLVASRPVQSYFEFQQKSFKAGGTIALIITILYGAMVAVVVWLFLSGYLAKLDQ